MDKNTAIQRAQEDLARRLGMPASAVTVENVETVEFPDAALGAPVEDEMAAQVITTGWKIRLDAGLRGVFEYRAASNQLRLCNFGGDNYFV